MISVASLARRALRPHDVIPCAIAATCPLSRTAFAGLTGGLRGRLATVNDRGAGHSRSPTASGLDRRRLLRLAAGAAGLGCLTGLAGCGEPATPVPAATVAPFAGNGNPALLIDAAGLRAALAAPPVAERPLVVDLSPPRTYRAGHVPGAVKGWWQDTMDPHDPVYGVVLRARPEPFTHARVLADLGIGEATNVVVYDDERNRYAARFVWYLRYVSHDRAAVLDGGLAGWRGTGGKVEEGEREPPSTPPVEANGRRSFVVDTEELAARLGDPALAILDSRTDEEAADDLNATLPLGQIPGSIRVPWTATLRDDAGRLRSPEELTALFAAAGVTPDREVAVVARFGAETGQPWLVLKLLGYPRVRVYDRGWAEWATSPELPIEPVSPAANVPAPVGM